MNALCDNNTEKSNSWFSRSPCRDARYAYYQTKPYYIGNFSADCSSFSHFGRVSDRAQDTDSWAIKCLVFCVCDLLTQAEFVVGFKLGVKSNGDKVNMRVIHTNVRITMIMGRGQLFLGFNSRISTWNLPFGLYTVSHFVFQIIVPYILLTSQRAIIMQWDTRKLFMRRHATIKATWLVPGSFMLIFKPWA